VLTRKSICRMRFYLRGLITTWITGVLSSSPSGATSHDHRRLSLACCILVEQKGFTVTTHKGNEVIQRYCQSCNTSSDLTVQLEKADAHRVPVTTRQSYPTSYPTAAPILNPPPPRQKRDGRHHQFFRRLQIIRDLFDNVVLTIRSIL
jgi:hypothetical protein